VGVANYLGGQRVIALRGEAAGKSFEHFIFMELLAYLNMKQKRMKISYWRTKNGLEVDFVIGDAKVAIEVKISTQVNKMPNKGVI